MTLGDRVAVMRARRDPAGRPARGALRAPAQPVRRRVHRLAGDELPARDVEGGSGAAAARRPAPARRRAARALDGGGARRHHRHPSRALRGRLARRATSATAARLQGDDRPAGVARLGQVRLLHRQERRAPSPSSSRSWPRTPGSPTCRAPVAARRPRSSRASRPRARSRRGRRPGSRWTPPRCTSSTCRTAATSLTGGVERPPAAPVRRARAPRLPSRRTAWNPPVAPDPAPSRRDRQIVGPRALTLREVRE